MWSRALWDIRNALGNVGADRIILQGQFAFAADTSMEDAALATVAAANELYGAPEAAAVQAAFEDRDIL